MTDDWDDFDDFCDNAEDDEFESALDECGLTDTGQCMLAGTEHCDFSCPMRDSAFFAGNSGFRPKGERKARGPRRTEADEKYLRWQEERQQVAALIRWNGPESPESAGG